MTFEQKSHGVPVPIAVILAGGRSRRMGGNDKGRIKLDGQRLIDRVIERLRPQAKRLILSAPHDYETGLASVPDLPGEPEGPVAGIRAVNAWLAINQADAEHFVTVPVDGPFLPVDLAERLCAENVSAIASDGESIHPTFACWKRRDLTAAWPRLSGRTKLSLKALADACGARRVVWTDPNAFLNLNSCADIEVANRLLIGSGAGSDARQCVP